MGVWCVLRPRFGSPRHGKNGYGSAQPTDEAVSVAGGGRGGRVQRRCGSDTSPGSGLRASAAGRGRVHQNKTTHPPSRGKGHTHLPGGAGNRAQRARVWGAALQSRRRARRAVYARAARARERKGGGICCAKGFVAPRQAQKAGGAWGGKIAQAGSGWGCGWGLAGWRRGRFEPRREGERGGEGAGGGSVRRGGGVQRNPFLLFSV